MPFIKWILTFTVIMAIVTDVDAGEYRAGITAGTAFLYGDNAASDPGTSIGLTYEIAFKPYLRLSIGADYQRLSGASEITDLSSIFYGFHEYDTTFMSGRLSAKLLLPRPKIQPYLSLGIGESLWIPGKNDDIDALPMKRKISLSVNPFVSIGTGVSFQTGQHWALDAGLTGRFYATDELDNVDGSYISGGTTGNDVILHAGIALVYRFGGEPTTPEQTAPVTPDRSVDRQPEPSLPIEEPVTEPSTPTEPEPPLDIPDTNLTEPDTSTPDTEETLAPSLVDPESVETTPDILTVPDMPQESPAETQLQRPSPRRVETRSYLVHIASFTTSEEADGQALALREAGYRTRISSVDRGDIGIWYRVYVGPYATRTEAEQTADRLIQAGLSDYAAVIEEE